MCHLLCTPNITVQQYNVIIDGNLNIIWHCIRCTTRGLLQTTASDLEPIRQIGDIPELQCESIIPNTEVRSSSFQIINKGSNKGGDHLVDRHEYCYTKKVDRRRTYIDWHCRIARKYNCKAGYRETGEGSYIPLPVTREAHIHTCIRNGLEFL